MDQLQSTDGMVNDTELTGNRLRNEMFLYDQDAQPEASSSNLTDQISNGVAHFTDLINNNPGAAAIVGTVAATIGIVATRGKLLRHARKASETSVDDGLQMGFKPYGSLRIQDVPIPKQRLYIGPLKATDRNGKSVDFDFDIAADAKYKEFLNKRYGPLNQIDSGGFGLTDSVVGRQPADLTSGLARHSEDLLGAPSILSKKISPNPEVVSNLRGIIDGVQDLSLNITSRFPQVGKNGELQYYFGGSISNTLAASARRITPISAESLPRITRGKPLDLPSGTYPGYGYPRPIGDLDFVPLSIDKYMTNSRGLMSNLGSSDYRSHLDISTLLPKHRQVGMFREFDTLVAQGDRTGLALLKDYKMPPSGVPHDVVSVSVKGREIFITNPKTALANKTIDEIGFMGRSSDEKRDFLALFDLTRRLYPDREIAASTGRLISAKLRQQPIDWSEKTVQSMTRRFAENAAIAGQSNASHFERLLRASTPYVDDTGFVRVVNEAAKNLGR